MPILTVTATKTSYFGNSVSPDTEVKIRSIVRRYGPASAFFTIAPDDVNNPTQFVFLPNVDTTEGVSIALAYRFVAYEVLFNYHHIDYDASVGGVSMTTKMRYWDLLFRRYYNLDSHIQPFVIGGLGISSADIENGSLDLTNPANPIFSRGKLNDGVTFSIGGGASFQVSSWLSFFVQGMWRFGEHDSVTGAFGKQLTEGNIDSDAWEVAGGVSVRLSKGRD